MSFEFEYLSGKETRDRIIIFWFVNIFHGSNLSFYFYHDYEILLLLILQVLVTVQGRLQFYQFQIYWDLFS